MAGRVEGELGMVLETETGVLSARGSSDGHRDPWKQRWLSGSPVIGLGERDRTPAVTRHLLYCPHHSLPCSANQCLMHCCRQCNV